MPLAAQRLSRVTCAAMDRDAPLTEALSRRYAVTAIAAALGISRAAVSQWRRVPGKHVTSVAEITGMPPHVLRPDLCAPPNLAPRTRASASRRKAA